LAHPVCGASENRGVFWNSFASRRLFIAAKCNISSPTNFRKIAYKPRHRHSIQTRECMGCARKTTRPIEFFCMSAAGRPGDTLITTQFNISSPTQFRKIENRLQTTASSIEVGACMGCVVKSTRLVEFFRKFACTWLDREESSLLQNFVFHR